MGMAFQLTDDLLDYTSSDRTLGKDIGRDLKEGKVTLPLIHALKTATKTERESIEENLTKLHTTEEDFRKVKNIIEKYGGLDYTARISKEHIDTAKTLLDRVPRLAIQEGPAQSRRPYPCKRILKRPGCSYLPKSARSRSISSWLSVSPEGAASSSSAGGRAGWAGCRGKIRKTGQEGIKVPLGKTGCWRSLFSRFCGPRRLIFCGKTQ